MSGKNHITSVYGKKARSLGFCNTPVDSQELDGRQSYRYDLTVSLDYLTLTYEYQNLQVWRSQSDFLIDWLGDASDWHDLGAKPHGRSFQHHLKTLHGIDIHWNILDTGAVDCMYILSGSVLSAASPRDLSRALHHLQKWYVSCNRLDVCIDDRAGGIEKLRDDIKQSWQKDLQSGFKLLEERIKYDANKVPSPTTYLGSRKGSAMFVRIYDKVEYTKDTKEVAERYQRFEVETKGFTASQIFRLFMQETLQAAVDGDWNFAKIYTRLFSASIPRLNFYSEKKSKNLSRNPIAKFWQDFKTAIAFEKIAIAKQVRHRSLEKSLLWLKRSVAPTLAMVKKCMGQLYPQYITELLQHGLTRLTNMQQLLIEEYEGSRFYDHIFEFCDLRAA